MTLYKIYKRISSSVLYKSSELKAVSISDHLIVSLKDYTEEETEKQIDICTNCFFKLLKNVDKFFINKRIEELDIHRYHPKPKFDINMVTVLSVLYINEAKNSLDLFEKAINFLFKED